MRRGARASSYNRPMELETLGLDAQYRTLREGAGLLERPDRSRIAVTGAEGAEFLQGQLSNDIEALAAGEGCYAVLLDRKGKIRADMRVLRLAADHLLIETESASGALVLAHLEMYKIGRDAHVRETSSEHSLLSLIGPRSEEIIGGVPLRPEHAHREIPLAGITCRAVGTDLGVDLLVPSGSAEVVRDALAEAGAEPIGVEAAEIARVEAGRPRVGFEIGPQTMPQEAGINERAVSFTKGCYIGQETVARLHYKGKPNRHLRLLAPERPVSVGDPVTVDGREVGTVGTAVLSPARGPLALAILRREAEPGNDVVVGEGVHAVVEEIAA
jgi:folate-binding protein YgfZ